ncbi:MAG: HK97 gp10 family phage protein [Bacteroidales bacterium]|nr:HK97 gp10 family phage protein [Bacteroidales bacterium]
MAELKLEGLEEFQEKLRTIERRAPDRILDKLDDEGKKLRKAARANTPKITGNLRRRYKLLPVEKVRGGYQKGMTNTAPHHHLVEKGHRKVTPGGREIGWTPGKFYLERTVKEVEPEVNKELENWLDELFKELSK